MHTYIHVCTRQLVVRFNNTMRATLSYCNCILYNDCQSYL